MVESTPELDVEPVCFGNAEHIRLALSHLQDRDSDDIAVWAPAYIAINLDDTVTNHAKSLQKVGIIETDSYFGILWDLRTLLYLGLKIEFQDNNQQKLMDIDKAIKPIVTSVQKQIDQIRTIPVKFLKYMMEDVYQQEQDYFMYSHDWNSSTDIHKKWAQFMANSVYNKTNEVMQNAMKIRGIVDAKMSSSEETCNRINLNQTMELRDTNSNSNGSNGSDAGSNGTSSSQHSKVLPSSLPQQIAQRMAKFVRFVDDLREDEFMQKFCEAACSSMPKRTYGYWDLHPSIAKPYFYQKDDNNFVRVAYHVRNCITHIGQNWGTKNIQAKKDAQNYLDTLYNLKGVQGYYSYAFFHYFIKKVPDFYSLMKVIIKEFNKCPQHLRKPSDTNGSIFNQIYNHYKMPLSSKFFRNIRKSPYILLLKDRYDQDPLQCANFWYKYDLSYQEVCCWLEDLEVEMEPLNVKAERRARYYDTTPSQWDQQCFSYLIWDVLEYDVIQCSRSVTGGDLQNYIETRRGGSSLSKEMNLSTTQFKEVVRHFVAEENKRKASNFKRLSFSCNSVGSPDSSGSGKFRAFGWNNDSEGSS